MKAPDAGRPIYITIRPLHEEAGARCHGRFCVYCDGRRMCISDDPLRDTARGFLTVGVPPNVVLIVRHDLGLWDVVTTTLGAAAQGVAFRGGNILNFRDEVAARARRRAAIFISSEGRF
jgi:hypothetical protein